MTPATKLKVSLTLSADIVASVDRDARRSSGTRSGVVEQWLRRAMTSSVQQEIEDATVAYYLSLRDGDREEDAALSRALSHAARHIEYDGPQRRKKRGS